MGARQAWVQGIERAWSARWAAVLLWLIGALLALPMGGLTAHIVHGFFAYSGAAEPVAADFVPLFAADLFMARQDALTSLVPAALSVLVLWVLVQPWMQAYTLGAVRGRGPGAFAGRMYGPLLRLAPLTWGFGALVLGPLIWGGGWLASEGLEAWTSERGVMAVRLLLALGLALVLAWISGAAELARVERTLNPEPAAWRVLVSALRQSLRHPGLGTSAVIVFGGAAALLSLLVSLWDAGTPRTSGLLIAGVIVVQQLAALSRAGLRVALSGAVYAAQVHSRGAAESSAQEVGA